MVSAARVRVLSGPKAVTTPTAGGVVYWMSRDQRAHDNWALLHAQDVARRHKVGLSVIFCLVPTFHEATIRQYGFMLRGLQEVERDLRDLGIPFKVLSGNPVDEVPSFLRRHEGCAHGPRLEERSRREAEQHPILRGGCTQHRARVGGLG